MKLKIELKMDSAAFAEISMEAARIMRELATSMESNSILSNVGDHETLLDLNGNRVGEARVTK